MKKIFIILLICLLIFAGWFYFVKGYITIKPRNAVPPEFIYKAGIPDMPGVRLVMDVTHLDVSSLYPKRFSEGHSIMGFDEKYVELLAISGGGANGAFSAGILCGLTDSGRRPEFEIVTGISTGAIIAPAAFVGSEYDHVIKDLYTGISDKDVVENNVLRLLFEGRPSILDTRPLRRHLDRAVTAHLMKAIAKKHAEGKRLYIATTNLDAQRMVVWDIGAIAAYDSPRALAMIKKVMLASASIPAAFPPAMFEVEAGGRPYNEMHVDGGVSTQAFGYLFLREYLKRSGAKGKAYVIINGKLINLPKEVKPKILDIAGASFEMLITMQGDMDLYRFKAITEKEGVDFNFRHIPNDFNEQRKSEFDREYMEKLFNAGYKIGISGDPWQKELKY